MSKSCVLAAVAAVVWCGTAVAEEFVDIDPPGALAAMGTGIDAAGNVSGIYRDSLSKSHVFLRLKNGTFITLGTSDIRPISGLVGGKKQAAGRTVDQHGYIADSHNHITLFDAPGASTTDPDSLNAKGTATGIFFTASVESSQGFLRDKDGGMTTFNAPHAGTTPGTGTQAVTVNDKGAVAGFALGDDFYSYGYLRQPDGTMVEVKPLDEGGSGFQGGTRPIAVNNKGEVAGFYFGEAGQVGFLRDAKGHYTAFEPENSGGVVVTALNDKGVVGGRYDDFKRSIKRGFLRAKSGEITVFDHPKVPHSGNVGTFVMDLNDQGVAAGYYTNKSGTEHAFIRLP